MTNTEATIDFGDPIYVEELPPPSVRGRASGAGPTIEQAFTAWLQKIAPGKTAQLPSKDADGAHTSNRVTNYRKIAKPLGYAIETRPVVPNKRYLVYVTAQTPEPEATDGKK